MRSSRTDERLRLPFQHNNMRSLESLIRTLVMPDSPEEVDSGSETGEETASSSSSLRLALSERIQVAQDIKNGKRNVFLALETIYSMDGDFCLLTESLDLFEQYFTNKQNRFVIIDEAHSTGVYGGGKERRTSGAVKSAEHGSPRLFEPALETQLSRLRGEAPESLAGGGEGLVYQEKEVDRVDIRLMTFGKAAGAVGAAVLCQPLVREYLINYARPLIFSTALPLPNIHLISSSLKVLASAEGQLRRDHLYQSARYLLQSLVSFIPVANEDESALSRPLLSLPSTLFPFSPLPPSSDYAADTSSFQMSSKPSPIIPILTLKAKSLSAHLIGRGYLVRPITYPTVPKGKDRIRICLHSGNAQAELDGLIKEIKSWMKEQTSSKAGEEPLKVTVKDRKDHRRGSLSSKL